MKSVRVLLSLVVISLCVFSSRSSIKSGSAMVEAYSSPGSQPLSPGLFPAAGLPAPGTIAEKRKEKPELLKMGALAPDWTLSDAHGQSHSLSEYRGKIVVLDFWASWCGPCAWLMPKMQSIHEKYGERNVVVLGINTWENGDAGASMSKHRCTYPMLLNGEKIAPQYGVELLPAVYVIGPAGEVLYAHCGIESNVEAVVTKELKKQS